MAEEVKQAEKKVDAKKSMSTFVKVIVGLLVLALGVGALMRWWIPFIMLVKGCIGPFLLLTGIIILAIAKE